MQNKFIEVKSLNYDLSQRTGKVTLKQLEEKETLVDKEADQMALVRSSNQHKAIAEEIILKKWIYV